MSREENEARDLNAIAASLSSLSPSTGRLDRDRLMFLAGEAAALSSSALPNSAMSRTAMSQSHEVQLRLAARRWAWPAAFSMVSAVAATLLAVLLARPEPRVIERVVRLPAEPQAVVDTPAGAAVARADAPEQVERGRSERPAHNRRRGDGDYLSLRDRVLARGIDSWTSSLSASNVAPPETTHNHRELLESVLNSL
ncbi:MAG TPA: hypothetical protein VND64_11980 [Pirellulales bacterium]|nr:hypothetical protein [Pirellulales bacterium]